MPFEVRPMPFEVRLNGAELSLPLGEDLADLSPLALGLRTESLDRLTRPLEVRLNGLMGLAGLDEVALDRLQRLAGLAEVLRLDREALRVLVAVLLQSRHHAVESLHLGRVAITQCVVAHELLAELAEDLGGAGRRAPGSVQSVAQVRRRPVPEDGDHRVAVDVVAVVTAEQVLVVEAVGPASQLAQHGLVLRIELEAHQEQPAVEGAVTEHLDLRPAASSTARVAPASGRPLMRCSSR